MKRFLAFLLVCFSTSISLHASEGEFSISKSDQDLQITLKGKTILKYQTSKPADSPCISQSACYFHPLTTPSGLVITDLGPDDHKHHRGMFLAWLDLKDQTTSGDFWGWGKYAPIEERVIVHREISDVQATQKSASFTARNEWLVSGQPLLEESLQTKVFAPTLVDKKLHVYDLTYHFQSKTDLTLAQHAFSGFTVRTRTDLPITVHDPDGPVTLSAPSHLKPETDWPSKPWYAFEMMLPSGEKIGLAVLDHPENPKTFWHNVAKIGMLNPCIVAPKSITLKAGDPLKLQYRVVAFDGGVSSAELNELVSEWMSRCDG